jgi:hypothetical protein
MQIGIQWLFSSLSAKSHLGPGLGIDSPIASHFHQIYELPRPRSLIFINLKKCTFLTGDPTRSPLHDLMDDTLDLSIIRMGMWLMWVTPRGGRKARARRLCISGVLFMETTE